MITNAIATH